VIAQRAEDTPEGEFAFAGTAPVRIVEMHVGDQAGWNPALDEIGDAFGFSAAARRRTVDHRLDRRSVDLFHDIRGVGDGVDACRLIRRERLNTIDDARLVRRFGDGGKTVRCALDPFTLLPGHDLALVGRPMHHDLCVKVVRQAAQALHHVDGTLAHAAICVGDGEAGRRPQDVMQPGDANALGLRRCSQLRPRLC
jgi:hypothetical protein